MPIFLLIRHGENDYIKKGFLAGRMPGIHLNEHGRQQAQALADTLHNAPIKAIYSSPLERALETAQPIAQALGLEVIVRDGLIETDIGEWQGMKLGKLSRQKIWRVVQHVPSHMRFPGGETYGEAQWRICRELESLASQHDAKDVVICVSHGDPIRLAVAYFVGMPLDMFQRLVVAPGSITTLLVDEAGSRLLALNYLPTFTFPVK